MQGCPLSMVAYGLGIIPLIKRLKSTYPDITKLWYAYNAGALSKFDHLEKAFKSLKGNGPARGYLTDPTKSILFMHPQNLEAGDI